MLSVFLCLFIRALTLCIRPDVGCGRSPKARAKAFCSPSLGKYTRFGYSRMGKTSSNMGLCIIYDTNIISLFGSLLLYLSIRTVQTVTRYTNGKPFIYLSIVRRPFFLSPPSFTRSPDFLPIFFQHLESFSFNPNIISCTSSEGDLCSYSKESLAPDSDATSYAYVKLLPEVRW